MLKHTRAATFVSHLLMFSASSTPARSMRSQASCAEHPVDHYLEKISSGPGRSRSGDDLVHILQQLSMAPDRGSAAKRQCIPRLRTMPEVMTQ
jgi:hypothetical protein